MAKSKLARVAFASLLAACLPVAPAISASTITDPISNPASQWAGIDYWGVQVPQFSTFDQLLTFTVPYDAKIQIFMQGSPKFVFSDMQINGQSILTNFTTNDSSFLTSTGYAAAGNVSLRIVGDYTCRSCWGDWFGGYVQVSQGINPVVTGAIPEPTSWAMIIAGMAIVGVFLRRRKKSASFA